MAWQYRVLVIMVSQRTQYFFTYRLILIIFHTVAFATVLPLLDKMVVVKEEWIALAILRLVELEKCVVEGAGAGTMSIKIQKKKFLHFLTFQLVLLQFWLVIWTSLKIKSLNSFFKHFSSFIMF